jgi:Asp-tRNA(Asn)/Glu-tRNA(Gln) amidotransferase A subunit family amidase
LEDAWHVAIEIATRVGGDPGCLQLEGPMRTPAPRAPRRLVVLETAGWSVASDEARQALREVIDKLGSQGVEFMTRKSHPDVEAVEQAIVEAWDTSTKINAWEWRWPLNTFHKRDPGKLSEAMLERFARQQRMRPEDYRAALAERDHARKLYAKLAEIGDGCLTLTAPAAAPVGLETTGDPVFAVPFSMLGVPAISLPLLQEQGLPLGLQVTGFAGGDAAAVAAAGGLLQALRRAV